MKFNFYDIAFKIDELLGDFSINNLERIEKYLTYEGIENYFFQQLAKNPNPFPWLKPLNDRGYFAPEKNPKPHEVPDNKESYRIPYWNVLDYLENVSKKNKENPDKEITKTLLVIVNRIINYRDEYGKRIENYRTDWMMMKIIFSLPIEKITEKHIEFIRTALNSKWKSTLIASEIGETVFPKLLQEKAEKFVLNLLDIILSYEKTAKKLQSDEKETYEYTSIMDEYWLKEALKKHKQRIAELCSIKAARIAINKIKSIVKEDKSQFNNVWIPAIEDHPQTEFPDRYNCQLVHFVRDMFEFSEPQKIKEEIENLLKEKHPIFKRIALHTINYHYKDLNNLFWNWKGNPLEENLLKHELYELLKNNCSSFSESQIDKVLQWIETKKYHVPEEIKGNKEQTEKRLAYQKKEWISALLNTKKQGILSLYNKYDKINPEKLDHPGFDIWMETQWEVENSKTKDEFLNKSNKEIANYLKKLKEPNIMDKEALSNILKICTSENPKKFTNNIKPFLNVPRIYQHALLWGLNEAFRLKKKLNWYEIFNFISELLSSNDFWNEKYSSFNYRNWIISRIAELIEDGSKDTDYAFDPELLPKAEEILLQLAKETESELLEMKDLINSTLNSAKGKVFSAMVNLSLRHARLYKMKVQEKWLKDIKEDFTKRLNRKLESSLEYSVILGEYLINLYWLDKKWVIDNINKIFPKEDETHWKAAFTGYLFYTSKIHKDMYFLLRENGHYAKAITTEFNDLHITDRLTQHICIGYIEGWEELSDKESLISKLIENKNVNQLSAIVNFFWILRKNLTDKIRLKIKPLWKKLYNIIKQNEQNPDYQKLSSKLSLWLFLVDKIDDEIFEWLKLSIKYIGKDHTLPQLIKNLKKHVNNTPKKVGELYLAMLNEEIYPYYKKEDIRNIVETLYKEKLKDIANRVCNLYGMKGDYFLKDIYKKYNNLEKQSDDQS